ncbi:SH3 domain-containing protein [Turneriella parva]|uniref:SH3b domain-containing protein n=1 Tax=Turneriella parva (strain ATCC BAA-1111 / DSM 21527 / NCTC 11395 / H) TaxID=869212 RepID=I4B0Y6_TURPD|nr:SH3 domain-containing protein [Turneriella parva]AFM10943.1 hypothetical protein Turpa_0283 [Turneriella parva DSM 21527]
MPVISPPHRQGLLAQLRNLIMVVLLGAGAIWFVCYRFGETTAEKADRLFAEGRFAELRNFSQKRLAAGEASPMLVGHYAVAEFTTNPKSNLQSLLSNIAAADERVIFRREALVRIGQIPSNNARAGEVLQQALLLENPLTQETKQVVQQLFRTSHSLAGADIDFTRLAELFPESVRRVKARELQFRASPGTEGAVLRRLKDGETLLLRLVGEATTVSGKKGRWVHAIDSGMESGWVFDAYLEKSS